MYIHKIVIENIRCFERVELDLTRPDGSFAGWTVIAGRNGAGKSTLLKAIALAIAGPRTADKLQSSFADWIRDGAEQAKVSIELDYPMQDTNGEEVQTDLTASLSWRREKGDVTSMHAEPADTVSQRILEEGPWSLEPWGRFLAAYGPFRRIGFRDNYQKAEISSKERLKSLFDEDATLAESIHWLGDIRAIQLDLENKSRNAPPLEFEKLEKQAQRHARLYKNVIAFLNDDLLPSRVKVLEMDMQRGLLVEQDGMVRALYSLSDGYRATIALALDIIRQMFRAFPTFLDMEFDIEKTTDSTGKPIVEIPYAGIILIDEVDAHLHVSWQQDIGFWLKRHFPKIQFIVTTHSPFICQAADPKGLIRLPAPGTKERVEHVADDLYFTVVNGDVDDAVMTSLFGLDRPHSDKAEALRSEIAKLEVKQLRGTATPEELKKLEKLSAQLPKTGSSLVLQALRKLGELG